VSGLLSFPHPVNEKAARTVAAVVALVSALALATGWLWLIVPLALGFVARVASGPTFSPVGRFAMWFARRFLGEPRPVGGPPKRFAQAIGAAFTVTGAVAWASGSTAIPTAVLLVMVGFASLESVLALCVGCKLFGLLMRTGLVPERVCAECADIRLRA
jgi:hypothetical protein